MAIALPAVLVATSALAFVDPTTAAAAGGPTLSILAGTGVAGAPTPGPATRSDLHTPNGIAFDADGDTYIVDSDNNVVEEVDRSGRLSIVAGTGRPGAPTPGPATSSDLNGPGGIAVDPHGDLFVADSSNNVVEKVTPSGILSVVAGTGRAGVPTPGPARASALNGLNQIAVDPGGDLFIADTVNNVIEKVTPSGILSIVAGTGRAGTPTPGPATSSDLNYPGGIAVDASGDALIGDFGNDVVEKVTPGRESVDRGRHREA